MSEPVRVRGDDDPTRLLLLESGRQLLSERGRSELIEVKLADACERAGLTTGAAYALWRSQAEYRSDLARYVASTFEWAGPAAIAEELATIVAESPMIEQALRRSARLYLARFCANEDFYLGLTFWSVRDPNDDLAKSLRANYELAHNGFRDLFHAVLGHYGLGVRSQYTIDQLTTATIAMTEGIALRQRVDPGAGGSEGDALATVYAEALVGLLQQFTTAASETTTPIPPSEGQNP